MALKHWMYGLTGAAALASAIWFTPNVVAKYRNLGDNNQVDYNLAGTDYVALCNNFQIPQGRIRGNELIRDTIQIGPDGRAKISESKGFPLDNLILEIRVNPDNIHDCELIGLRDPRPNAK